MVVCWSRMGLAGLFRPASGNEMHVCQSQYRTVNCELATSTCFTVSICLQVIVCIRGEALVPAACLPALRSQHTRTITGVCATTFESGHASLCEVLVVAESSVGCSAAHHESPFLLRVKTRSSHLSFFLPGVKMARVRGLAYTRSSTPVRRLPNDADTHKLSGRATERMLPVLHLPYIYVCY